MRTVKRRLFWIGLFAALLLLALVGVVVRRFTASTPKRRDTVDEAASESRRAGQHLRRNVETVQQAS